MARRFISTHASGYSNRMDRSAKQHIVHVAVGANETLCGRKLTDPFLVYAYTLYKMCSRCDAQSRQSPASPESTIDISNPSA